MLKQVYCTACAFIAISSINAATIAYWRLGDDVDAGFFGDSSTNDNALSIDSGSVTQNTLPGSGSGSDFSNPVPQNSLVNTQMANSNGVFKADASDVINGVTSLSMETYFNLKANSEDSTQYLISRWRSDISQRSFAMGIDESDGRVTGVDNQIYLLLSGDGSSSVRLDTTFTMVEDIDYFIAWTFDGTTDTNDVVVYQQDLTNALPMQSITLSSGFNTLHESTWDELTFGALINTQSQTDAFYDEIRLSDQVLSQGDLLNSIPEPGHYALLIGLAALGLIWRRRQAL